MFDNELTTSENFGVWVGIVVGYLLILSFGLIPLWLAGSFVALYFNPFMWSEGLRLVFIALALFWVLFTTKSLVKYLNSIEFKFKNYARKIAK